MTRAHRAARRAVVLLAAALLPAAALLGMRCRDDDGQALPPVLEPGPSPEVAPPAVWDDFWFLNDCVALGQCNVVYTLACQDAEGAIAEGAACEFCDTPYALVSECHFTFDLNGQCSELKDAWPDCGLHWVGACRPNGTCDAIWDGHRCLRSVCVGN